MAIEIFGILFKPEISIGDITGIAALISSALIFWFGYSRTRKSEQIKIARELTDRVTNKKQQFDDLLKRGPQDGESTDSWLYSWVSDIYKAIDPFMAEIEYFTNLVRQKEIEDSEVLPYHAMQMLNMLMDFKRSLKHVKISLEFDTKRGIDTSGLESYQAYVDSYLEIWLSKLPHEMWIVMKKQIEDLKSSTH